MKKERKQDRKRKAKRRRVPFESGAKPLVHRGDGSGVPDQTTRRSCPVLLVLSAKPANIKKSFSILDMYWICGDEPLDRVDFVG